MPRKTKQEAAAEALEQARAEFDRIEAEYVASGCDPDSWPRWQQAKAILNTARAVCRREHQQPAAERASSATRESGTSLPSGPAAGPEKRVTPDTPTLLRSQQTVPCPVCHGTGRETRFYRSGPVQSLCEQCGGSGRYVLPAVDQDRVTEATDVP